MFVRGLAILRAEEPEVVYLSTTIFPVFMLGFLWSAMTGVPYVLDYQDPWVGGYSGEKRGMYRTKKYAIAQWIARRLEPIAASHAAGITAVSQEYIQDIVSRNPSVRDVPSLVLPFGASSQDIEHAARTLSDWKNPIFDVNDGLIHWVYAGAVTHEMSDSINDLLSSLKESCIVDEKWRQVRVHFVGTSYAAPGQSAPAVLPIAERLGLLEAVSESTSRLSYFDSLRLLLSAGLLLVFGSKSRGYLPSKLFSVLLTGRPALGIFEGFGPGVSALASYDNCRVRFVGRNGRKSTVLSDELLQLKADRVGREVSVSAERMTHELIEFFEMISHG